MDEIFKNDKVMGIVAIVTLALTAYLFWYVRKENKPETTETPAPTTEE